MSVRGREWTPANTARAIDVIAALLALVSCSTNDPLCAQVAGGEVQATLVATGWSDVWDGNPEATIISSGDELSDLWNHGNMTLHAEGSDPESQPEWVDNTQMVLFMTTNGSPSSTQSWPAKFMEVEGTLVAEFLVAPYCSDEVVHIPGLSQGWLIRTPPLKEPVICEVPAAPCLWSEWSR